MPQRSRVVVHYASPSFGTRGAAAIAAAQSSPGSLCLLAGRGNRRKPGVAFLHHLLERLPGSRTVRASVGRLNVRVKARLLRLHARTRPPSGRPPGVPSLPPQCACADGIRRALWTQFGWTSVCPRRWSRDAAARSRARLRSAPTSCPSRLTRRPATNTVSTFLVSAWSTTVDTGSISGYVFGGRSG